MRLSGALAYDPTMGFTKRDVCIAGDRISSSSDSQATTLEGCYIIPGLTDLHFHGCVEEDFSDGSPNGLVRMAEYLQFRGVTQMCPAGMTLTPDNLRKICSMAAQHKKSSTHGAELVGIKLEGPFLSMAKKGAQNGDWLQTPSPQLFRELVELSQGLVKMVAIAPELEGASDFIREFADDVVISMAHTTCNYDSALEAFGYGVRHVTHLFNAMNPFAHRDPGPVGAALDSDCNVEIICDGVHLHPAVVRAVFAMFGPERVVLVSDGMRATGMQDGAYTLGGQAVTVSGNKATLSDGTIAGSVTDLMNCMRTAVSFGIPIKDAVRAAAYNPAKVLGIDRDFGSLENGKVANIAVLNADLSLRAVIARGQLVKGSLS